MCSDSVDFDWTTQIEEEREGIPARFPARDSLARVHWWSASPVFWWLLVSDEVTTRRV
jgi:hypothetical protein